jgi:hypothetical protein
VNPEVSVRSRPVTLSLAPLRGGGARFARATSLALCCKPGKRGEVISKRTLSIGELTAL